MFPRLTATQIARLPPVGRRRRVGGRGDAGLADSMSRYFIPRIEESPAITLRPDTRASSYPASWGVRRTPENRLDGLVLILRPVVHEEQQPGGRQALDEPIEQRLGLGVDPVEIFEDDQQRLQLALPQQQPLHRVQGTPAALDNSSHAVRREEEIRGHAVQGTRASRTQAGLSGSSGWSAS
jgi:hypothetical protein